MYWAILYDRTGIFEQQTIEMRQKLEAEINGDQLAALDELMEMRSAMGLDAPSAAPSARPIARPSMTEKVDMVRAMREQMMAQQAASPPPDPGSA